MTMQISDKIIYGGKKYDAIQNIPFPKSHERIVELPEGNDDDFPLTACWRGYIAAWEITEEKFLLLKIDGKYQITGKGPVEAVWVTTTIKIPQGKHIYTGITGMNGIYSKEIHFTIAKGIVTDKKIIEREYKDIKKLNGKERLEYLRSMRE